MRKINFKRTALFCMALMILCTTKMLAAMPINVGIVLPLHNNDGDGKRAVEYYRGLIMAADELKAEGVEVNFFAWNCHQDVNISSVLNEPNAAKCDIFFGPMYTKQLATVQAFAAKNDAKVIIPFSISNDPSSNYSNVFQVYQEPQFARTQYINKMYEVFKDNQFVVVGCNDANTTKGDFTAELRGYLNAKNMAYTITNLSTTDDLFVKAFNPTKQNVVVLNSSSNASLKAAFKKLDTLIQTHPELKVSMFGYTEWLTFVNDYEPFYHKYDVYIPTHSFYNPADPATRAFEAKYKKTYNCEMLSQYNPRFALLGYDHGRFFFRGFSKIGKTFPGVWANNDALQSRIHFAKVGQTGGMQNIGFKFIHFKKDNTTSALSF